MTIDQQLERLTERHEALTQSVELIAAENRHIAAENRQRDKRMGEIMEAIARLVHIAEMRRVRPK